MATAFGEASTLPLLLQFLTSRHDVIPDRRDIDPIEQTAIGEMRRGNPGAYDYLVRKYMRRVVSIATALVRNTHEAEDLAQEAFVKAFETIGRFREGDPFGPWIGRIVTNLAIDAMRRRKRFPHDELTDIHVASRIDGAGIAAEAGEIARRIDRALDELPEMQRAVARLHLIENLEHEEIAIMTSLSEGTVRSHLSLARKRLRERLADLYGGIDE